MDVSKQRDIARALDSSIADVAAKEFDRLKCNLKDSSQIPEKILGALEALGGLQYNYMPRYNAWDSLFYLTWYQPVQINLALTLVERIANGKNPLSSGKGNLQISDFGCGAHATRFGLALAVAEAYEKYGSRPSLGICPSDSSCAIQCIGDRLWRQFCDEISDEAKYPALEALREVCGAMNKRRKERPGRETRWLTTLHVAYKANWKDVKCKLDKIVCRWKPDLVLVTAHPVAQKWAYSVDDVERYEKRELSVKDKDLVLHEGTLKETTKFRLGLHKMYHEKIDGLAHSGSGSEISSYLKNPVSWRPSRYEARCVFYSRLPSTN